MVSTLAAVVALAKWRELSRQPAIIQDRIAAASWGLGACFSRLRQDLQATLAFGETVNALVAEARWRGIPLPGAPAVVAASAPAEAERSSWATRSGGGLSETGDAQAAALETAWVLHALSLATPASGDIVTALAGPLDRLERLLRSPGSVPAGGEQADADETLDVAALAFQTLVWAGRRPDPSLLLRLLAGRGPARDSRSPIAEAHLASALQSSSPFAGQDSELERALERLERLGSQGQWIDPRHASPVVATAHALLALPPERDSARQALHFLLDAQRPDGSWGWFHSTPEETASCLQALVVQQSRGAAVDETAVAGAAGWLAESHDPDLDHEPLFVGRALYCPRRMVQASVLAALSLTESSEASAVSYQQNCS